MRMRNEGKCKFVRPLLVSLLLLLAASQLGCSRGPIGQDTNERLEAYDESSCGSDGGIDFFGLSISNIHGCSNFFAGERDFYTDGLRSRP